MKNATITFTGTADWYNNGKYANSNIYTSWQRAFSFTGFGSNDRKKKRLPTAGSYSIEEFTSWRGSARIEGLDIYGKPTYTDTYGVLTSGADTWSANLDMSYSTAVYNDCLTKLYDGIRETELNLAVSLAEYREAQKLLTTAIKSLGSVITLARKVRRKLLQNPSLVASEVWLSYKYAWLPLYSDVYNLLRFVSTHFEDHRFRARRKVTIPLKSVINSGGGVETGTGVSIRSCFFDITASVTDKSAFNRDRITSLDPVLIAWELVPFSFVVDWFWNIGGYLQNQEAAIGRGLTFKHGYVTEVAIVKTSTTYERYRVKRGGQNIWDSNYQMCSRHRVRKRRVVLSDFPRARFPRPSLRLGWQRILSLTSLFRTVLLGKVK